MKISEQGLALIKKYEGYREHAYLCPAGVWTIGYGSTRGVTKGMRVSPKSAETLLMIDVKDIAEDAVNKYVKVDLSQGQFDSLCSFAFNLGGGNLKASTLLRKLNAGDYEGAANEFPKWRKAGGKVLSGLVRRRAAERDLFLYGGA